VRRIAFLALLLALVVPATVAAHAAAPGDGTLSMRNGEGSLGLTLRGVAIGKMSGVLEVDYESCSDLLVYGAGAAAAPVRETESGFLKTVCVFRGEGMRLRLTGTQHEPLTLRVKRGEQLFLSVVGSAAGWVKGAGPTPGQWSLNGAEYVTLPTERTPFKLAAPASTP
jgi:hypothetical protein